MAENELDAFLGGKGQPAPEAPPEQEPAPQEAPEQEQEAPAEAPEQEDAPEIEAPKPGERTVPLAALEKVRRDHKERAARLEGELAELRRQYEEAKRVAQQPAAPPPPPPQPQYIPNPAQDPQAFAMWQQEQLALSAIDARLNMSEIQARKEYGAEAVEAAAAEFKQAMQANPSLRQELYQQPHPYEWLMKRAETLKLQKEIGDDPAAYRARLRAEIEAEMQAAQPAAPAPVSPAARLAPSLANARSAAPRASGAWNGPTPLQELFPPR